MPDLHEYNTKDDELNHLSEEVYDIINSIPSWIVRWGTTVLLLVVAGLGVLSWFLHYPDTVTIPLQLTAHNAPKPVSSKITGKLVQLLVREGELVREDQLLAFMESTGNHMQVLAFDSYLDQLYARLSAPNTSTSIDIALPPEQQNDFTQLGELQSDYQTFKINLTQFLAYQHNGYYEARRKMLQSDLDQLTRIAQNLEEQKQLTQQDLNITQKDYQAQQNLASQKVISAADFRREESKLLNKEMALKQTDAVIFQNNTAQVAKRKEILELDKLASEQRGLMVQAINTLRSSVNAWKARYILSAPMAGVIYFSTLMETNQSLIANQEVFFVSPKSSDYFAEALIPQRNLGKIHEGQRVIVKFAGYPYQEFGSVSGLLSHISRIPNRNNTFLAKVIFPTGLRTKYGQTIAYRQGMAATGEIITRDSRLIQKLFYNLREATN